MKKHLLPIGLLFIIYLIIGITNYIPGTWLSGWDTLHPEFDFTLNIKRSLFAVWQEYQGNGLMGGMGHATDLPRQLLLWLISIILPTHLLRYFWTILMLFAGSLGVYVLVNHILNQLNHKVSSLVTLSGSFIASLYYLFSLVTVQTFFTPYEAFVTHYGSLPWLIWSVVNILDSFNRKNLLILIFLHVLFMTQWYVPTLFLVYLLVCAVVFINHLLTHRNKTTIQKIVIVGLSILFINSFWLFPFVYNTLTNSQTIVNSKINQMATEDNFLRNLKFGTLSDTLLLHNFWFDATEFYPREGKTKLMLSDWNYQLNSVLGKATSILLVLTIIIGAILSLKIKQTRVWFIVGLLGFTMLASAAPPFSWIVSWLRSTIPLLFQFFRSPFTKWGIELAMSYAVFIGIFVYHLLNTLNKRRILACLFLIILAAANITFAFPMLQGKLIDKNMFVKTPQEYFDLFAFFENKPLGRIANLPQHTFWDWKYYRWGQFGSGFLWYGIEQPILDRAFDSWGKANENYYWEASLALYQKSLQALENVLQKYDVVYILLDENVVSTTNYHSLYYDEIKNLLENSNIFHKSAEFGKITVYRRIDPSNEFISIITNPTLLSPAYNWTDNDIAFQENGAYVAINEIRNTKYEIQPYIFYPFRSLFTKRAVNEKEFNITESDNEIVISNLLDNQYQSWQVIEATNSSQFIKTDKGIGVAFNKPEQLAYDSNTEPSLNPDAIQLCNSFRSGTSNAEIQSEENFSWLRFSAYDQRGCLSYGINGLEHRNGYLFTVTSRHISGQPLRFALINQTAKHTELETFLPTNNDWTTTYFILPPLASDGTGYDVYIINDSIGRHDTINDLASIKAYQIPYDFLVSLKLTNPDSKLAVSSLQSADNQNFYPTAHYPLPTANYTVSHPNPAEYWITIQPSANSSQLSDSLTMKQLNNETTLVLSQSFHPGWKAYLVNSKQCAVDSNNGKNLLRTAYCKLQTIFPFIFGEELKDHVLVNNWSNGWQIRPSAVRDQPSDCLKAESCKLTAYIIFWPQLLEFLGFAILPIPFLFLFLLKKY